MVAINLGYTAPINRPGQAPLLTLPQVWAGLQRKVHHAEEFVPIIVACTVLSESLESDGKQVVRRRVRFRPGARGTRGNGDDEVTETCELYPPCRIDFHQESDGSKIANYVTHGPSGEPHDLFLTYVFEWRLPETVREESVGEEALVERYKQMAKMAVESSIETIRRMVSEQAPAQAA